MKCSGAIFIVIVWANSSFGQSPLIPLNSDYYHLIDRYEIKSGKFSDDFFTSYKPYRRRSVGRFLDSLSNGESDADKFNIDYLRNDNWEFSASSNNDSSKPLFKKLYRKKSDAIHVDTDHFDLHVNPVAHLGFGNDGDSGSRPYIFTRGLQLRGRVDDKVAFYSFIAENQMVMPQYGQQYLRSFGAIPSEGFWKQIEGTNGVDFFTARGYIDFKATKHINIQFGHDKNFIGNGYRSMILSDFSSSYFFLKFQTKVWRINYTNLFAELIADAPFTPFDRIGGSLGTRRFPKKYMALHHLSINITDNLNIGIFEATIFAKADTLGGRLEFNYLNPVIFYRGVEQLVGSPDNALLGIDFKWNPGRHLSFYGQFLLDELIVSDLVQGTGWWGNKISGQLGVKYIDAFGQPNLDLQLESNFARPYTYTHESLFTSYTHYRQPLAHPLGANFSEFIGIARYQPIPRLNFTGKVIYADQGRDENGLNYGSNVLRSYLTIIDEFDNTLGQGVSTKITFLDLTASYQLKHNLFIDLKQVIRKLDSSVDSRDTNSSYTALSLRLNIAQRLLEF